MPRETHDYYAHIGSRKIYRILKEDFYFDSMRKNMIKWLRTCITCQKTKYINYQNEQKLEIIKAESPGEIMGIDFIGPMATGRSGCEYALVCVDVFSRFTRIYPMKAANTQNEIEWILEDWISKYGKPQKIQSDRGTQFTSQKWTNKCEKEGIEPIFCAIRHPQREIVERCNKEIKRCFKTLLANKSHGGWVNYVE